MSKTETEIKMEELSNKIAEYRAEHRAICEQYIREIQEKLKPLVGMSFRDAYSVFRIIGIPEKDYSKTSIIFNEYQLPVLAITDNITIYGDLGSLALCTKFSKAAHAEDPVEYIRTEYQEVSSEEFDAELEKAFDEIRNLGKCGDA